MPNRQRPCLVKRLINDYFSSLLCDRVQGSGDETCHFYVHSFKDKGYITLESTLHKGIFVGMMSDGRVRPTVDTGQKNVRFYPEVIQCKFVTLYVIK